MKANIRRTLIESVFSRVNDDIDSKTSTCIGANEEMTKLKKSDLWFLAEKYDMFERSDIVNDEDAETWKMNGQ